MIDSHFHGAMGADFSDGDLEGLRKIETFEKAHGITKLYPATMTLPTEQILRAIRALKTYRKQNADSIFGGFYLEGPFFHPAKVGAQNPAFLQLPNEAFVEQILEEAEGLCKVIALAPELPGAMELIRRYRDQVCFSIGHTTADGEIARRAFDAGARRITHLYNGMLHYDEILCAAADDGDVKAELICDGVHNDRERILNAFAMLGAERVILISDSMRATGMPDGIYDLGGQAITVKGNLALTKDGAKAGSVTTLTDCAEKAISLGIKREDALMAANQEL